MARQYSVTEFIQMTPFQKQRLKDSDPEQYAKLFKAMNDNFPKEDPEAQRLMSEK